MRLPGALLPSRDCSLVIAALLLSTMAGSVARGDLAPSRGQTVRFQTIDNRIFIDVVLNGRGPFHCILDTGAAAVISRDVAKALGLPVRESGVTSGVGEKAVPVGRAKLSSVAIGPMRMNGFEVSVIDLSDERDVFGQTSVDAILGLPVFNEFVVRTDYGRSEVTFFDGKDWRYQGHGIRVPFERPSQIPVVKATLDGVPARFGIDTGARSSLLLFAPFVSANGLFAKYHPNVEGITGWGIGGPVRSYVARADVLTIGALRFRKPVIRLPTQHSGDTKSADLDGLVGPDVLKRSITYIDYSRNEIIFEPLPAGLPDDSFDRFGAWIGQGEGCFRVIDVFSGGPASSAGLKKGDEILAVDGSPAASLRLPVVRDGFKARPAGTSVTLRVRSGAVITTRVVVLRDLV
jgi:hypothetical protein